MSKISKNINIDYLFYECLEYHRIIEANPNIYQKYLFYLLKEDQGGSIRSLEFVVFIDTLIEWHRKNFDLNKYVAQLNIDNVHLYSMFLVHVQKDLEAIFLIKEKEPLTKTDDLNFKNLIDLLYEVLRKHDPLNYKLCMEFFMWIWSKQKFSCDYYHSMPPVGKFGLEIQEQLKNKLDTKEFTSADLDNNENKKNINFAFKTLESALRECYDAFAQLENNLNIDKVVLKPQNSYYRRLQHTTILENGYVSQSEGEGNLRSVVVFRKT